MYGDEDSGEESEEFEDQGSDSDDEDEMERQQAEAEVSRLAFFLRGGTCIFVQYTWFTGTYVGGIGDLDSVTLYDFFFSIPGTPVRGRDRCFG